MHQASAPRAVQVCLQGVLLQCAEWRLRAKELYGMLDGRRLLSQGGNSIGFFRPNKRPQNRHENRPKVTFERVTSNFGLFRLHLSICKTIVPFLTQQGKKWPKNSPKSGLKNGLSLLNCPTDLMTARRSAKEKGQVLQLHVANVKTHFSIPHVGVALVPFAVRNARFVQVAMRAA